MLLIKIEILGLELIKVLKLYLAFSPIGMIFGYAFTGTIVNYYDTDYLWRIGIFMQAACLVPVFIFLATLSKNEIDF